MRSILIASVLATLALTAHAGDDDGHHHRDKKHVPKVFDAQGREVGPLESDAVDDGVYIEMNGAITFVPISRVATNDRASASATQFQWGSSRPTPIGAVAYPSSDCSGAPVLFYEAATGPIHFMYGPRPSYTVRQGADVTVYIASDADAGPTSVRSTQGDSYFPPGCRPLVATYTAFTVDSLYVITQHHPEPLTIRY